MNLVIDWFKRHLADPQVVILVVILLAGVLATIFVAPMLVPVIAAAIIAYILQGMVVRLNKIGIPRLAAVWITFLSFMALLVFFLFGLLPILSAQITQLVQNQLPQMVNESQKMLMALPEHYPNLIDEEQLRLLTSAIRQEALALGQNLLSYSVASVVVVMTFIVYLILVPLLVFFFLKDRDKIAAWVVNFLPEERRLVSQVWQDANAQFASYIRGKVWEIIIVGLVTYVVFTFLGLEYAALLAALTGLSVLIPYIGAAVVTLPVAAVGFFQFGLSPEFAYVMIAYGVIQALDGNVLAPLLFSEVVKLHPIAIVVAILVFGGIWGFWGVFFAIPLATLIQSILRAWPGSEAIEALLDDTQKSE